MGDVNYWVGRRGLSFQVGSLLCHGVRGGTVGTGIETNQLKLQDCPFPTPFPLLPRRPVTSSPFWVGHPDTRGENDFCLNFVWKYLEYVGQLIKVIFFPKIRHKNLEGNI